MSYTPDPIGTGEHADCYEIRLQGHLDTRWSSWFDGLILTRQPDGSTLIQATELDQSALHGVLRRINDLGLTLISVTTKRSTS
ncbi:hypothetical protein SAMN05444157_1398 [Frankineae bacterium MT45]|nr:hypothetical protein SAMN05444157_1398 [Frankineae bacterium MT45]